MLSGGFHLHFGTMWCGSHKVHSQHEWKWTNNRLRPETVMMSCGGSTWGVPAHQLGSLQRMTLEGPR